MSRTVKFTPMIVATLSALIVLLAVRICLVLQEIWKKRRTVKFNFSRKNPAKTLIVLGSGGHTTEILSMTQHLDPRNYHPIEYCKADTDTTSTMRLNRGSDAVVHNIPRSREVKQSYISSVATTLYAIVYSIALVARVRPDLVLCNGPGTGLPICLAGFMFRILGWCEGQVVFIESYCRVETLSLTGKLLYPFADMFVVHWKELHQRHPSSQLVTSFVQSE